MKDAKSSQGSWRLFICYTPFHVYVAELIAREVGGKEHNVLVDVQSSLRSLTNSPWDHIVTGRRGLSRAKSRSANTQLRKLANARRIYAELLRLLEDKVHIEVWYSHLAEYLPNRLFFSRRRDPRFAFFVLHDGMLNYYQKRAEYWQPSHIGKALLGFAAGFPFRPFSGHLTGVDRHEVSCQVVLGRDDLCVYPEKSRSVAGSSRPTKGIGHDVIVLGQEAYMNIISREYYEHITASLLHRARDLAGDSGRIYYKPHHINPGEVVDPRGMGTDVQIIGTESCIEEYLLENKCQHIVSTSSSALFNLKVLYQDRVECWSCGLASLAEVEGMTDHIARVRDLFSAVGVHVL